MVVTVVGLTIGLTRYFYEELHPTGRSTMLMSRPSTIEEVDVTLENWVSFSTDPALESINIDPVREGISWQAVLNGDFAHPIVRTAKSGIGTFGEGVRQVHLALVDENGPRTTKFILKRNPK